jgi:hypothetical protein
MTVAQRWAVVASRCRSALVLPSRVRSFLLKFKKSKQIEKEKKKRSFESDCPEKMKLVLVSCRMLSDA